MRLWVTPFRRVRLPSGWAGDALGLEDPHQTAMGYVANDGHGFTSNCSMGRGDDEVRRTNCQSYLRSRKAARADSLGFPKWSGNP